MQLTTRRLNRATLARQLLLGREPLEVAEGVRRVVALQAQEAASPYLALWNRLAPFDPAGLDATVSIITRPRPSRSPFSWSGAARGR